MTATTRRPGRGAETQTRLTQAAVQTFAERGFAATRVSDIVARAGVSQPTFYYFFESKEALFGALVGQFRARLRGLIAERAACGKDPHLPLRDTLQETCAAVFHVFAEQPALTRLALQQAPDAGEVVRGLVELIAGHVRAAQEGGRVRVDLPAALVAEAVVGSVERLTWRALDAGELNPGTLARHVAALHVEGLTPRGEHRP